MSNWNAISRLVEGASGLAFGRLAVQGTAANQAKDPAALSVAVGSPVTTGTGNGSIGTPTVDAGAQPGNYRVVIIEPAANGGTFQVERPDGVIEGTGVIATPYNGSINFTLADGATDFVAGDYITVPVTQGGGGVVLGITLRDPTMVPANPDNYPEKATAAIMNQGVIWVTAGATVAAGDPVYYVPATGRFTNVPGTTNIPVGANTGQARFDSGATNGNLVKVRINLA
jgi:hypothetical protein